MPCVAQAMRALRRAHYVFPHSHRNTSSTAERQERWAGYLHVVGCTRTPKRQLKVSLASDLGQAVKGQSEHVRGYEGASCHNTSRMFLVMGLTPFCAGLRGSESALWGASACDCCCCCSDGMDRARSHGFWVNSVARGDIRASSLSSKDDDCAVRCGSEAEICACRLCRCCCSRMLGEDILPRSLGMRFGAVDVDVDNAVSVSSVGCGLALERNDIDRRGGSSCRPTGPIPSCANKADLSKGFVVNSDVVGDMIPKLSAASKSGDGCSGVR